MTLPLTFIHGMPRAVTFTTTSTVRPLPHCTCLPTAADVSSLSSQGASLLCGCVDGSVTLWDAASGQKLDTHVPAAASVCAVTALAFCGPFLVSAWMYLLLVCVQVLHEWCPLLQPTGWPVLEVYSDDDDDDGWMDKHVAAAGASMCRLDADCVLQVCSVSSSLHFQRKPASGLQECCNHGHNVSWMPVFSLSHRC
jgi:hypothetical protein